MELETEMGKVARYKQDIKKLENELKSRKKASGKLKKIKEQMKEKESFALDMRKEYEVSFLLELTCETRVSVWGGTSARKSP